MRKGITELTAERIDKLRTNNDHLTRERDNALVEVERLREEMQSAKADAWDDGYEAHRQMVALHRILESAIEGIARKPSNPYR